MCNKRGTGALIGGSEGNYWEAGILGSGLSDSIPRNLPVDKYDLRILQLTSTASKF